MWQCAGWVSRLRHAASVRSRTIMKKQPSVEAAAEADLSNVHRAFLPRLTESTADRWIKATTQLFLSLNGEENGMWSYLSIQPLSSGFYSLVKLALMIVVTDLGVLSGRSPPCMLLPACQAPCRDPSGIFVMFADCMTVLPKHRHSALSSKAHTVTHCLARKPQNHTRA